ncbi:MAG: chemotaxis protein CheY [Bacteroides sp. SM1_62]|nr:MAG: chemotaxis protein CheY [Bacteroides sp. SM23_62]KPL21166.1 MAG: chemotaxis protein CheY [Bacteroides sp. SM1_62]
MKKILIIEDEDSIRMALEDDFRLEHYEVEVASDGLEGLDKGADPQTDLIILDIMLPGINGYEICKKLRSQGIRTPIIMLTAKGQEIDRVLGLEIGADDYVTKPFSPRELQARVKAVLRRMEKEPDDTGEKLFRIGDLEVDFQQYECSKNGKKVSLTAHEFGLLKYLIQNRGRAIDRYELLEEVWGKDVVVSLRTVDTHMANLRKKIEDDNDSSRLIISIRGVGYKFRAE